jgi:hypothetical protein
VVSVMVFSYSDADQIEHASAHDIPLRPSAVR